MPAVAMVPRRAVTRPPQRTAAALNIRAVEQHVYQGPIADPIRQSDTPARPSRMQIAVFQAIAPIKAVMRDEFWLNILARPNLADFPRLAGQFPFDERQNIHRPPSDAYGSLLGALAPPDPYSLIGPSNA